MGFLKDLDDAFMEGFRKEPSPSWFGGLKVKRTPSPIDPAVLAQQYERVAAELTTWQAKVHDDFFGGEDDTLADCLADFETLAYLFEFENEMAGSRYLFAPWRQFVQAMASTEPIFQPLPSASIAELASAERLILHEKLTYLEKVLKEPDHYAGAWSNHLANFAFHILENIPEDIRSAPDDIDPALSCPLVDCLPDPHETLAKVIWHFVGGDSLPVRDLGLFSDCQEKMLRALLDFSNMKPEDLEKKQADSPLNHQKTPAAELVPSFMGKTPFTKLFMTPVPYGF